MHLKDAMRRREVSKRWRLAERWDGASPEARIALRGTLTRAYLPCDARQSSSKPLWRRRNRCSPQERVLQKVVETHLLTLYRYWEATERGRGHKERAT